MPFQKNNKLCLDRVLSTETKTKISKRLIGNKNAQGRIVTKEQKDKYSLLYTGTKQSSETVTKKSLALKGKRLSKQACENIRLSKIGKKNPAWKGGVLTEHQKIRGSKEYQEWRNKVFTRDKHTCVMCGSNHCLIHADHIKRFSEYPELRLSVDNGRTLCVSCHKSTETYGRK